MSNHPNVLVLMCDQMQAGRMGFVDGVSHTPNMDRLAREGVHFTNAYTVQGQCVPSRAVFQTGLYAHECGVMINYGKAFFGHRNRLGPQHVTLGHAFQRAGYRTVYFGKSHLGVPLGKLGYERSFVTDGVRVGEAEARELDIEHVPDVLRNNYLACAKAEAFFRDYRPDGRPLFFTFSTNLPHPPFFTEPSYASLFDADSLELPRSGYDETFEGKPPFQKEHAEDGHHGVRSEDEARAELHQYLTMIAATDEHFGRIIAEFRRLGLWKNTVVLLTADHGDMMNAHRMRLKGTLPYDELYRIPFIMKLPVGRAPGRQTIDDLVSNERFAVTLLRAAGVAVPETFRNGDFYDAFSRQEHPEDEKVFFEHYGAYWGLHPFRGVVNRKFKYIRYYGEDDTEEMYDLENDPAELHNIAANPSYDGVRRELVGEVNRWWSATGGRDSATYESDAFKQNLHNTWTR